MISAHNGDAPYLLKWCDIACICANPLKREGSHVVLHRHAGRPRRVGEYGRDTAFRQHGDQHASNEAPHLCSSAFELFFELISNVVTGILFIDGEEQTQQAAPKPNPRVLLFVGFHAMSQCSSVEVCSDRRMHRKPMWLIPVSIICGWRAAGR
jgi:hypothetical protein